MVMMRNLSVRNGAVSFIAVLPLLLHFKGHMANAMFLQLPTNEPLDLVGISVRDDVHSGVVILAIHAPNMDVVYILHTGNFGNVFLKFLHIYLAGRFLKNQLDGFL